MLEKDQALLLWVPRMLPTGGLEAPLESSRNPEIRKDVKTKSTNSMKSSGHLVLWNLPFWGTSIMVVLTVGSHSMSPKVVCCSSRTVNGNGPWFVFCLFLCFSVCLFVLFWESSHWYCICPMSLISATKIHLLECFYLCTYKLELVLNASKETW